MPKVQSLLIDLGRLCLMTTEHASAATIDLLYPEELKVPISLQENVVGEKENTDDEDASEALSKHQPPSDHIVDKLREQAEFYFSDSNVLKDKFLLSNIKNDKDGYVNLKLLSSFRRMQAISKDPLDLAFALKSSTKLLLNSRCTKVRRVNPIPEWDNTVYDRTVIAINMQIPEVSVNAVKTIFGKCGQVTLVRIVQPGQTVPEDLQQFVGKHPELSTRVCAVVEFARPDEAERALLELGGRADWRGMQVLPLMEKFNKKEADGSPQKEDPAKIFAADKENIVRKPNETTSPSNPRKKSSRVSRTGAVPIVGSEKGKLEVGGSPSPKTSPGGRRKFSKPAISIYEEGAGGEPDGRSAPKPIPGRMQKKTMSGSPDIPSRKKDADDSPLSSSPVSFGTSPWARRRAMMENSDSFSPSRNLISVIRQPRGPTGEKGFTIERKAILTVSEQK